MSFGYAVLFVLLIQSGGLTRLQAQSGNWVKAVETEEGDTLIRSGLSSVTIRAERQFNDEVVRTEYYRILTLRRDVERVRPYAKEAGQLLISLDSLLSLASGKKERQQIIQQNESAIQLRLEARLQQLTRQQGEVMVKLIHRETGQTAFAWMQSIKGKASAFYWQNLAKAGGVNLKLEYRPDQEDREIERIVRGKPY